MPGADNLQMFPIDVIRQLILNDTKQCYHASHSQTYSQQLIRTCLIASNRIRSISRRLISSNFVRTW